MLLGDRGGEFLNKLVERMTANMGIQHNVTYSYYPEGNAKNERIHAVIEHALRIFAEKHPATWNLYTDSLMYMINARPSLHTGISPYEILFGMKPRPLHNTTPFLEYDHEEMQNIRKLLNEEINAYLQDARNQRATLPPPPLKPGQWVKMVRRFPLSPGYLHPGKGPYVVTQRLGKAGYQIKHVETGKVIEAPRNHLFPFARREEDGKTPPTDQQQHQPMETEDKAAEEVEEEEDLELIMDTEATRELEEEIAKQDVHSEPAKKKRRTALDQLKSYNQPTTKKTQEAEVETGSMVLVKEGKTLRLGEIREVREEDVMVQWYGTTSPKGWSRSRWKFYPGWESSDGETTFVKSQSHGKPATCIVPKKNIHRCFKKLTLQSTLPSDLIKETLQFTL